VVFPSEVPAVDSPSRQGMVRRDHYEAPRCPLHRRTEGINDLRLRVSGTVGGRVPGLGAAVQPPLSIKENEPDPHSEVHHARSGASAAWPQRDSTSTG
jgi:hypothetical protein